MINGLSRQFKWNQNSIGAAFFGNAMKMNLHRSSGESLKLHFSFTTSIILSISKSSEMINLILDSFLYILDIVVHILIDTMFPCLYIFFILLFSLEMIHYWFILNVEVFFLSIMIILSLNITHPGEEHVSSTATRIQYLH